MEVYIVCNYGFPHTIVTNNGKQFTVKGWPNSMSNYTYVMLLVHLSICKRTVK